MIDPHARIAYLLHRALYKTQKRRAVHKEQPGVYGAATPRGRALSRV